MSHGGFNPVLQLVSGLAAMAGCAGVAWVAWILLMQPMLRKR